MALTLRIDILNPAGVKQGPGPLTTAVSWSSTPRLDRAGSFSFSCPAADPRTQYLALHNIVVAYEMVGGTMTEIGRGIIDNIHVSGNAQTTMLTVSGNDMLRELAWRSTGAVTLATGTTALSVSPGLTSLTPLDVHLLQVDVGSSGEEYSWNSNTGFPPSGFPWGYNLYNDGGGTNAGSGIPTATNWKDMTNVFDGNSGTQVSAIPVASKFVWYIAYDSPFDALSFVLGTNKATHAGSGSPNQVQYFNGMSWVSVSGFTDGTVVSGEPMAQSGVMAWTLPNDWVQVQESVCPPASSPNTSGNYTPLTAYWVRILMTRSAFANPGDPGWGATACVDVSEITITGLVPTSQAAAQILGYANGLSNGVANPGTGVITGTALPGSPPSQGWVFDVVNGQSSTNATNVYAAIQDDTVLSALMKLSTLTNEHFRVGAGLSLVWLGSNTPDSGIRAHRVATSAVAALAANPLICQIMTLDRVQDAAPLVTRVIPYGSGNQLARTTLAQTTRPSSGSWTAADGSTHHFVLDTTNNYLYDTDAETAFGRIEQVQEWNSIGPVDLSPTHQVLASNALYDVALVYLQQHSQVVVTLKVGVTGLSTVLYPGQTIHVIWREIVNGYTALDIDASFIILECLNQVTQQGWVTTELTLSQYPRYPLSDTELLAQLELALKQTWRYGQPLQLATVTTPPTVGGSGFYVFAGGNGQMSARSVVSG